MRSVIAAILWLWFGLGAVAYGLHGCAKTSAPTTLQILGAAIDPAYSATMDGCILEQDAIVTSAQQAEVTAAQARVLVESVRKRCHRARDTFEELRRLHGAAVAATRAGDDAEAQRLLAELEQAWKGAR